MLRAVLNNYTIYSIISIPDAKCNPARNAKQFRTIGSELFQDHFENHFENHFEDHFEILFPESVFS